MSVSSSDLDFPRSYREQRETSKLDNGIIGYIYKVIKPTFIFTILLLIGWGYGYGQSSDPNILKSGFESLDIEKQFVYSEKEQAHDLEYMLMHPELFAVCNKALVNQGIGNKYHWIKIPLLNNSHTQEFIFEFNQTNIDSLRCYLVKNNVLQKTFPTKGLHYPQNNVPSYLSNKYGYIYPFEIAHGEQLTVYIRGDVNDDAFRVMNRVWTKESYKTRENDIQVRSSIFLIFFGFVVLICFLSIAMFAFTRQRLYLYYMGFVVVIFFNLAALRHFVSPLVFEDNLFLGNNFVEMFGYLQLIFVLLYTNHFLELNKNYPRTYKVFKYTAVFTGILFVLALFLRQNDWFYNFSYIFSKFVLVSVSMGLYFFAVYLAFKRQIMAYYYVIAYFPLFLFVTHFILTAMRLTDSYNPLEWEYVIFIEISVLTIAMAHRYYLIMRENSDYQLALINEQERGIHGMIEAQENERSRIAKDLHDGVVQQIGSVILKSRAAFEELNLMGTPEAKQILEKLDDSNQDLRSISHKMMPRALKELGIIAALQDVLADSLEPAKIKYNFEYFNIDKRLSEKIEVNLYRIGQELVNNLVKHSRAKTVNVQLFKSQNSLIFMVEDDGIGMKRDSKKDGIGLLNIQSRTQMLKGLVNFETSPSGGTLVTIKIPIEYGN